MGGYVALLVFTGVLAVADWLAVARGDDRTRTFTKPAVMVALIAAVIVGAPAGARTVWFVVALLASLARRRRVATRRTMVRGGARLLPPRPSGLRRGHVSLDTSIGWLVVGALLMRRCASSPSVGGSCPAPRRPIRRCECR
ncbi:MAG: hypothetical protein R2705_09840 [Ilumatobacteraceae bacterium]